MKKNFLLTVILAATVYGTGFAQVSTTPEVPRNYKPAPKELLPMPGELTEEMIFPVLGKYSFTDEGGLSSEVLVYRDADNKGSVWINGMPQGRFKADLRESPATYKIPKQKTLQNATADQLATSNDAMDTEGTTTTDAASTQSATRFSGKSLDEGTLILDTLNKKLYIHIGAKFNEENPAIVFPEMTAVDTAAVVNEYDADAADTKKKKAAKKAKGTTYVLAKVIQPAESEFASPSEASEPTEATEPAGGTTAPVTDN